MSRRPHRSTLFPYTTLFRSFTILARVRETVRSSAESMDCAAGQVSASVTRVRDRSEEHTSELQSRQYLVCRLLLEKKKHQELDHAVHEHRLAGPEPHATRVP